MTDTSFEFIFKTPWTRERDAYFTKTFDNARDFVYFASGVNRGDVIGTATFTNTISQWDDECMRGNNYIWISKHYASGLVKLYETGREKRYFPTPFDHRLESAYLIPAFELIVLKTKCYGLDEDEHKYFIFRFDGKIEASFVTKASFKQRKINV